MERPTEERPTDSPSLEELVSEILELTTGSGERLAEEVGVSYASLYAWSRGRRRPSRANASALAREAARRARRLAELSDRLLEERTAEPSPGLSAAFASARVTVEAGAERS